MSDLLIPDQSHPDMPVNLRPEWAVKAIDRLGELAQSRPMWEVIDFIVSVWAKNKDLVEDFEKDKEEMIKTRANQFGANKDMNLRYLAEIPVEISDLIETFYHDDIQAMGLKEFWREFARRYSYFRIATKI